MEDPDKILEALEGFFVPRKNVYESFVFNLCVQKDDEPALAFAQALHQLSASCEYGSLHNCLIRDRLIISIKDKTLRE